MMKKGVVVMEAQTVTTPLVYQKVSGVTGMLTVQMPQTNYLVVC
jgi:hypothetical protein